MNYRMQPFENMRDSILMLRHQNRVILNVVKWRDALKAQGWFIPSLDDKTPPEMSGTDGPIRPVVYVDFPFSIIGWMPAMFADPVAKEFAAWNEPFDDAGAWPEIADYYVATGKYGGRIKRMRFDGESLVEDEASTPDPYLPRYVNLEGR